jgi:large subunit ribosomal protein L10
MPNVEAKAMKVEELRQRFAASPLVVLTDFKGATVKEIDKVRRTCEASGVKFQVVKNTLCVRAVHGTEKEKLADHFRGNVGVLFSSEDPIATARLLKSQLRDNEKFAIKVGFFEGGILDEKGVHAVAELPSREQLLSTLLGTIQEGPRQLLGIIQAAPRDLLYVLSNYAAKLEEGGQS